MWWLSAAQGAFSVMQGIGAMNASERQAQEMEDQASAEAYEGYLNKYLREIEADNVVKQSKDEAENIKYKALMIRSQQMVAHAASGIIVGEGSAQVAADQVDKLASQDALAALYSGINKSTTLRATGDFAVKSAVSRARALDRQAAATEEAGFNRMLGSIGSAAGNFAGAFNSPTTRTS